jgi:hypothetical protein
MYHCSILPGQPDFSFLEEGTVMRQHSVTKHDPTGMETCDMMQKTHL